MDDVGAASKRNEVYSYVPGKSQTFSAIGNWLFLKYLPPWKRWGPYPELSATRWEAILRVLEARDARLTVAITASWVEDEDRLIPYPEKFPDAAEVVRAGARNGLLEVANHGLTHCVLEARAYRPRLFKGNREYHREFLDWIPLQTQRLHLARSQAILETWLGEKVITFVPPGNRFVDETLRIASEYGLRIVSCSTPPKRLGEVNIIGNQNVVAFHDRDIVYHGVEWLERELDKNASRRHLFVRDLATAAPSAGAVLDGTL